MFQFFSLHQIKKKRLFKPLVLSGLFGLALLVALGLAQILQPTPQRGSVEAALPAPLAKEPIQPIPLKLELDQRKVKLGSRLFNDPLLSTDGTISCATCHHLSQGGADGLVVSQGMNGHLSSVNSPTVFNSGFNSRQFWDGRAKTLEDQIDGPMSAIGEMGGLTWQEVTERLDQSPDYVSTFRDIYPDAINADNVKDAIATFERSLYTPNAPFDQYLRGNEEAISTSAKQGYDLFKSYGCVSCHQGMVVGGNMFQTLGVFGNYFADRGSPIIAADLGRYNVTKNELDRHVFKVPGLRNVTKTAPYFHDGQAASLDEAIKLMGRYQLGVEIPQKDVDLMMQFLISLTGQYQGKSL